MNSGKPICKNAVGMNDIIAPCFNRGYSVVHDYCKCRRHDRYILVTLFQIA